MLFRSQTHRDLAALRAKTEVLRQSVEASAEKDAALQAAAARIGTSRRAAHEALEQARRDVQRSEAAVDAGARALDARGTDLAAIADEARTIELEEHRSRARLTSVEEAYEQFAGFEEGVRAVLTAARSAPSRFPGLVGAVADLLNVPEGYRQAIAAALGRRLHCLIVDGRGGVDAVVAFLMEDERRGAATVLALDTDRKSVV